MPALMLARLRLLDQERYGTIYIQDQMKGARNAMGAQARLRLMERCDVAFICIEESDRGGRTDARNMILLDAIIDPPCE